MTEYEDPDSDNALTVKYLSIEDYMASKSVSIEVDLPFDETQTKLVFSKPVFDMAFIVTHNSLITEITSLQAHFQTKFSFTTHCIYLPDISKLKYCIRDIKLHDVVYALVAYGNTTIQRMDIYILYPTIEVQKDMKLDEIENLVTEDYNNFCDQVKRLKSKPSFNPHPENNDVEMTDVIRYLICLLSDNRMLEMNELSQLEAYLCYRKTQLEKIVSINPDVFDQRPLQACRQDKLKYYVYEPITRDQLVPAFHPYVPNSSLPQQNALYYAQSNQTNNPSYSLPAICGPDFNLSTSMERNNFLPEKYIKHKAKPSPLSMVNGQYISKVEGAKKIPKKTLSYKIKEKPVEKNIQKKNDSTIVEYMNSEYYSNPNFNLHEVTPDDVISLSSGTITPSLDYDLMPITPMSPFSPASPIDVQSNGPHKDEISCYVTSKEEPNHSTAMIFPESRKRKIIEKDSPFEKCSLPKFFVLDLSESIESSTADDYSIKNCSESFLNLFRLVLSLVPLSLPHDNALITILTNGCNEVQGGILVPSLKIVKIDYESCKNNGVNEIITGIFGIYDDSLKPVDHITDLEYLWTKYFPDHLSNFSILIIFYRFVKLLILHKLFNTPEDCRNKVLGVLEKINVIVNFDFKLPIIADQNHLNCFPGTFEKVYKESDNLHNEFTNLPKKSKLCQGDSRKKLDRIIKQKKIEFMLGPLLQYFVNSINSIHWQMNLEQIKKVYNAIRTLRFCLQKIYPIKSSSDIFGNPKSFNVSLDKPNTYNKDIIDELKWLLEGFKQYQGILFTAVHYEFINCILDFSFLIEKIIDVETETFTSKPGSLIILDPAQFITSFSTLDCPIRQYHPDSEIEFLKTCLKDNWVQVLKQALKGEEDSSTMLNGNRIIKEINVLLPSLWNLRTFDEAIVEAFNLFYGEWVKIAQQNPQTWYKMFLKNKVAVMVWLNMYQLPYTKAAEEVYKCENMLKNEFQNNSS